MLICQYVADGIKGDRAIEILEARIKTEENLGIRFPIKTRKVTGDFGYWTALAHDWGIEDLVIVEHDIVVAQQHIQSFEICRYPFCTVPYKMPDGQWSLFDMQQSDLFDGLPTITMVNRPTQYSEGSGLGLVRITRAGLRLIPMARIQPLHWSVIDLWISNFMKENLFIPWHVHYPPCHQVHS